MDKDFCLREDVYLKQYPKRACEKDSEFADHLYIEWLEKELEAVKEQIKATENIVDTYKPETNSNLLHDKTFNVLSRLEKKLEAVKVENFTKEELIHISKAVVLAFLNGSIKPEIPDIVYDSIVKKCELLKGGNDG